MSESPKRSRRQKACAAEDRDVTTLQMGDMADYAIDNTTLDDLDDQLAGLGNMLKRRSRR